MSKPTTYALLFCKEDGTLYLGQECKTPECADQSVPFAEWDMVIGRVEILSEPKHGMHYAQERAP